MLRAPGGTCTDAAGPTSAMRPSRTTIVWSGLGVAPVPSTKSTCVSATTAVSTTVYWRTSAASESGRCAARSEEHTSELQSHSDLVCRLLLEKKKKKTSDTGGLRRAQIEKETSKN